MINKQIVRDTIIYNMNTVMSQMDKCHKLYKLGVDLMEYDTRIYKALEDNILLMLLCLTGKADDEEFKTSVLDLLMWVLYERDCKSGFDITDSETGEVVANVEKPEDFVKYIESLGVGHARNAAMLLLEPEVVVAFNGGVGTEMMVKLSSKCESVRHIWDRRIS